MQVAKKILSRLFRVFVHVYIHHFDRVSQMGAEAHVNTCYKHFYYFVTEFHLTDHKELEEGGGSHENFSYFIKYSRISCKIPIFY